MDNTSTTPMNVFKYILARVVYGGGVFFDLAKWLVVLVIVFIIFTTFFYSVFVVDGESMEPNLHNKELVLWNKHAFASTLPQFKDVVVMNYPGDPYRLKYVKRIIGLPNQTIKIKSGNVFVDGKPVEEDFLPDDLSSEPDGTWKLGDNEYFLMGDNRPNSNDSRFFGPVEGRFILGKAISIVFPRFRPIEDSAII